MKSQSPLYFSRPQPLSPHVTANSAVLEDGRWYRKARGKLVLTKGVPNFECIYHWWFEYLKRSDKYRKACASGGKGMQKLYNDFGNIYEYKFWDWWKERGADLFGERRGTEILTYASVDEALGIKENVKDGSYVLLAIPTSMKKTDIKKQLGRFVKELEVKPIYNSIAKYPLNKTKIDAESLSKCLAAYDMKAKGHTNVEIGAVFRDFTQAEIEEFSKDARTDYTYYYDEDAKKKGLRKTKKNTKAIELATEKVEKMLERKGLKYSDLEELVDKELGILTRKDELRLKLKNYLNVSASRMLAKAMANIAAVENGNFPIGHKTRNNSD